MTTLVELLAALTDRSNRGKCLAVLYYGETYSSAAAMTTNQIRARLVQARVPNARKVNVADVLAKSGFLADSSGKDAGGHNLWRLTDSGRNHVRQILGPLARPAETAQDLTSLTSLLEQVRDPIVRGFLEEGVKCLGAGALRAAVVFVWSGSIRTLQGMILEQGAAAVNAALTKHDPKTIRVARIEDFSSVKDRITLLAARELGILDKGQWTVLQSDLDLRNQCGHPTRFQLGVKKASSFLEDIVNNVFSNV